MPSVFEILQGRLYWIVANTCRKLYGMFPLFGTLRASLAVIHQEGKFLVIQRNDGRGVSLPGGISNWREAEEQTLDREVLEETGMTVSEKKLILRFYSEVEFPCNISLFEVQTAGGASKNSWEGSLQWMTIEKLEPQLVESQRPVISVFRQIAGGEGTGNA